MLVEPLVLMSDRNLDYARRLVADIPDEKLAAQPPGAAAPMNHATWVLGHLAFVADSYGGALGGTPTAPKDWAALFGMKSKPEAGPGKYSAKAALLKAYEDGHGRMVQLARAKPAEYWSQAPADERRRARFPTNLHMLVHMLVNHDAIHLGQLSAWRRAQGLPSV